VHFPQITAHYPFYGKGVYRITGKITEEFSYFTLEVATLEKLAFAEDVRLSL
jgi:DNA polymerase-3 subunit alpha